MTIFSFLMALLEFLGLFFSIYGAIKLIGVVKSNKEILELSSRIDSGGKTSPMCQEPLVTDQWHERSVQLEYF